MMIYLYTYALCRYLAISRPLWHRSKVTARLVTVGLLLGFLLIVFVNKFVFIAQLVPMTCRIHLIERRIMGWSLWILFGLCLLGRIVIYLQNRRLILGNLKRVQQKAATDPQSSITNNHQHQPSADNQASTSTSKQNNYQMAILIKGRPSTRMISEDRTKRMEQESRRSLVAGLTVLIILNCPLMIFAVSMNVCRTWFSVPPNHKFCDKFTWLVDYFKQLSQIHGLFYPIMCWVCDHEIFEAVKYICSSTNRYRNR